MSACLVVCAGAALAQPTVTILPGLPVGAPAYRHATAVSNGGVTVVGESTGYANPSFVTHAWRWTSTDAGGITEDIGFIPQGPPLAIPDGYAAHAYAVSADGSVVVGVSEAVVMLDSQHYAFRWTAQGGMQSLGYGDANAVSGDGTVVVGYANNCCGTGPLGACRWTSDGVAHVFGTSEVPPYQRFGCNFDGSVVAGTLRFAPIPPSNVATLRAFRWTQASGFQNLGTVSGGHDTNTRAISADGSTVVGSVLVGEGYGQVNHAFRWTPTGGMQDLGFLLGGADHSEATGVSADGRIVAGTGSYWMSGFGVRMPFIWSPQRGMVDLRVYLASQGVDVTNIGGEAFAISPDGTAVVGGDGLYTLWLVRGLTFGCLELDAQPAPATVCAHGSGSFTVTAGGNAPFTYQWQWQPEGTGTSWVNLEVGDNTEVGGEPIVNARDVGTPTLDARPLAGYINFAPRSFRCLVTNSCGSVSSGAAVLTVCMGDYNCDAGVDGDDVIAFFGAWDANDAAADVNGDGGVDGDDVIAFFERWDTGC